jgi:hypothetical protein
MKQLASKAYSPTMKKEATCSSDTPANLQRTTQRYIPEDRNLNFELLFTDLAPLQKKKIFERKIVSVKA